MFSFALSLLACLCLFALAHASPALYLLAPHTSFGVNNFPNLVSGSITSVFLSYWSDTSFLIVLGLALVYFVRLVGAVVYSKAISLLSCQFNPPSLVVCMRASISARTVRLMPTGAGRALSRRLAAFA